MNWVKLVRWWNIKLYCIIIYTVVPKVPGNCLENPSQLAQTLFKFSRSSVIINYFKTFFKLQFSACWICEINLSAISEMETLSHFMGFDNEIFIRWKWTFTKKIVPGTSRNSRNWAGLIAGPIFNPNYSTQIKILVI